MKFGTVGTISAVALLQQQCTGVRGVATSTRNLSPLIVSSKQWFQGQQNLPQHQHHRHLDQEDEGKEKAESEEQEDKTEEVPTADAESGSCDVSFVNCLSNEGCSACFQSMTKNKIDWATMAYGTECDAVINPLVDKSICDASLKTDVEGKAAFCSTMKTCAVQPDADLPNEDDIPDEAPLVDCDALTSCNWEGFKSGLIGDGACHEWIDGCYNTAICGYDGGDCCKDKCQDEEKLVTCGSDRYFCRDPTSETCQTPGCIASRNSTDDSNKEDDKVKRCADGETGYFLRKYASFGNGWDRTYMTIDERDARKKGQLYKGTMKDGAEETELICLSSKPTCYDVQLGGGVWGNRVSWQLKPMKEGAPEIASGGAPLQCQFTVGGDECENTCKGQSDEEPHKDDSDHHSYEVMEKCIESTCLIQLATCEGYQSCVSCMKANEAPAYCYSDPNFNALVSCSLCNCVPEASSAEGFDEYCATMDIKPTESETGKMPECNADQILLGVSAVLTYSGCSYIGFEAAVSTDFDNDHFGRLDAFESCATAYTTEAFHGGKTALDCMRILQLAVKSPTEDVTDPADAISNMANHLYNDGKKFCDCSATASEECPVCLDFKNFKTLMYESLDACRALDDIDCAAWAEFSTPCQTNMLTQFGNAAFSTQTQCDYVHDGCGKAGPFPSFRNIDCENEIEDTEAWDFYQLFASNCLKDQNNNTPAPADKSPVPVSPPSKTNLVPTSQYSGRTSQPTRQYIPDGSTADSNSNSSDDEKKKSSGGGGFKKFLWFIFFCIAGGGCYWYYKRTREFDYVRFRRARNYGGDSTGMYEGSSMENSASSFEPPSLPPPPSSYESNNNFA
eukprot:CAMPEP_0198275572 /NCGR_PEP_ID=MMETSP1447-20131203/64846_1 /TAXON_ID=420782 /ORGANISM="Chaetoceros dichaeta, Strain CCMP1751" /LENGTH=847 /DNA_ID=CAMNT_0043970455 /DNA_START=137 /DNA_END=2680 /DNA_ORIENTATION=-